MAALEETAGALVAAISIGAIVEFGRQALAAAADIKTMATQTGLGIEELQVWQATARAHGPVDVETVRGGIESFNRSIVAVADGNKQAVDTFNKLGIGVLDAAGHLRSISDLSQEAVRRLASMKDPIDQARAAHELFGKSGQQLLPVLLELGLSYADAVRIAQESVADCI